MGSRAGALALEVVARRGRGEDGAVWGARRSWGQAGGSDPRPGVVLGGVDGPHGCLLVTPCL